jgi:5-methylcytosine-specific restriction endonuclease McrA
MLLSMVAKGEIHLSGVQRLSAHLTRDNHQDVLAAAKHRSTRDIEKLVAQLAPQPDVPTRLRRLPEPRSHAAVSTPAAQHGGAQRAAEPQRAAAPQAPVEVRPRRAPDPTPLSPCRYKLEVTLDQQAHDQLRTLQDLLAHQIPNGDPALIVKRALEMLLVESLKKKAAMTENPRTQSTPRGQSMQSSRAIPAQLKREVWERDDGRCGFVGEEGRRCNETRGLEYAHVRAWSKGGEHRLDNLGLRCRAHNAYEANQDYGEEFMQEKRRARQRVHRVKEPGRRYQVRMRHALGYRTMLRSSLGIDAPGCSIGWVGLASEMGA